MSPILLLTADRSGLFTTTVVISGIFIVVGMLLLLILIFYLFGMLMSKVSNIHIKIPNIFQKIYLILHKINPAIFPKQKEKSDVHQQMPAIIPPTPVSEKSASPAPIIEDGISEEVVAAITAAIAMTDGTDTVIKAIKKKTTSGRNPWAFAATVDNTRPF